MYQAWTKHLVYIFLFNSYNSPCSQRQVNFVFPVMDDDTKAERG